MTPPEPLVSVITVNFNGAPVLGNLLTALRDQSYRPHEVLVVDNASTDGSVELVRQSYPEVRLIRAPRNQGFTGGNNLGLQHATGDFLALINNDAVPARTWLEALVAEAQASRDIAAVGSKLVFLTPFLPIDLTSDTFRPAALGASPDARDLGVLLDENSAFAGCDYRKPIFGNGFHGPERRQGRTLRWTSGDAELLLPIGGLRERATLGLWVSSGELAPDRPLEVRIGSSFTHTIHAGPELREHRLEVPRDTVRAEAVDVINNAGSFINRWGEAGDRGIHEPDRGQYDRSEDADALCGASVLLRREILEKHGFFDRDFFMYYEDTDLCWRLRAQGYRLRYHPSSVARHLHAATSVEWSPTFTFLTARNKVLMIAKNGSALQFLRAYGLEVLWTLRLAKAWVRRRQSDDVSSQLATRLRVHLSLARLLPKMLLKRFGLLAH